MDLELEGCMCVFSFPSIVKTFFLPKGFMKRQVSFSCYIRNSIRLFLPFPQLLGKVFWKNCFYSDPCLNISFQETFSSRVNIIFSGGLVQDPMFFHR